MQKKSMMNKISESEIKTPLVLVTFPFASGSILAQHSTMEVTPCGSNQEF